jgi:hypothetical protein
MFQAAELFNEKRGHVWVSKGVTPICGWVKNPSPHVGLPVGEKNEEARSRYVIEQGTFLSIFEDQLVPANGGIADEVTYSALDVEAGVQDGAGSVVTAASTKTFAANKPIGVTIWDLLQNPATLPNGFQTHLLQTAPTIRTEGVIVLPIVYMTDAAITADATIAANIKADMQLLTDMYQFEVGDLLVPDSMMTDTRAIGLRKVVPTARTGGVRKFLEADVTMSADAIAAGFPTMTADSVTQIVARVIATTTDRKYPTAMLKQYRTDGVDIQGDATHGFDRHLWNAFKGTLEGSSPNNYVRKAIMININK